MIFLPKGFPECTFNQLKCNNGRCIDLKYKCNGITECGDGSDEIDCGVSLSLSCVFFSYSQVLNLDVYEWLISFKQFSPQQFVTIFIPDCYYLIILSGNY